MLREGRVSLQHCRGVLQGASPYPLNVRSRRIDRIELTIRLIDASRVTDRSC